MKKNKVNLMCDNLFWRLRDWVFRSYDREYLTVGQIIDKVYKYAPKTIKKDKDAFILVVEQLWAVNNDYTIYDDDYIQEDFNWHLEYYFPNKE